MTSTPLCRILHQHRSSPAVRRITRRVLVAAALTSLPALAAAQVPPASPATPPAAGAAATAPAPAPVLALPAARQSWYGDRRTFAVGDIITVLIDDYTITTAVKENIASDTRRRSLGINARMPASSKNVGLETNNDASQNERGSARRENRFQNEMSVRVVAVDTNGIMQVKGTKKINVDKAMQDIELTGWVRARDVSAANMVESARVADATIGYASPGSLSKPKQGIVSKILGAFWP